MTNPIAHFLSFLSIAFFPSVIGAISGIGGGIIIKPALDALAAGAGGPGLPGINFLSGCTVLTMSAVSLLRTVPGRRKTGIGLETRRGTALALGAALGGLCGKMIFTMAFTGSPGNIKAIQSLLLIILSSAVMLYMLKKDKTNTKNIQNLPVCVLLGLGLGMSSAFLGIGGGPINIMVISWFLSMDAKTTALHSLYTIFLSQLASLILIAATGTIPPVLPASLIAMTAGGAAGGLAGSRIAGKLRNDQAEALFKIVLLLVILLSVYNLF
jgi:uncharacterized membrane protein YfcA